MATVGFVGLGIMGRPMLKNLLKAGITFFFSYGSRAAPQSKCADGNPLMPNEKTSPAVVPGDRWMEIDLY